MEGALETGAGARAAVVGEAVRETVTGGRGEQPHGGAMCAPESAEHLEGRLGQRHVTVFFALAVDVQQQPAAVDIRHLQMGPFQQPQPAGVDGGQTSPVDGNAHRAQSAAHFLAAQHHRQLLLAGRPDQPQGGPLPLERLLIEELDPAQGDGGGGAGDLLLVRQVQEVLAQILLVELVRAAVMVLRQLADGGHIALLGSCREPPQLHILNHPLTQR
jgi:hypothetical protein